MIDIIRNWPDKNRYDTLKKELIHRLSGSQSQWIQHLLKREEIWDRILSQFLRHMPTLAGEAVPDEFLRTIWVNRLFPTSSAIVTAMAQPLDELATITDQIQESSSPVSPHGDQLLPKLKELRSQVDELTRTFTRASLRQIARLRSKSRQRRRSKSSTVRNHCWHHRTFGDRSTKCHSPCNYVSGNGETRH